MDNASGISSETILVLRKYPVPLVQLGILQGPILCGQDFFQREGAKKWNTLQEVSEDNAQ
jgi:hypothetical protein